METADYLTNTLEFKVGDLIIAPSYMQAGALVALIFLLVLSLAMVRRHTIDWSIKGALFGIFLGFLLALTLEGFLIIGGKTVVTEILGWKDAPKPLVAAIDIGRSKLVDVLGVTDEIPSSFANSDPSVEDAVEILQSLDPTEITKVKNLICAPN